MAFTLGCKSRTLVAAETYERDECACGHHDLACARAAREEFFDDWTWQPKWYERGSLERIAALQEAGDACYARAVVCGDADPCSADQSCAFHEKERRKRCVRVAREGEACWGVEEVRCEEGLECGHVDWVAEAGCDDPWCVTHPEGVCKKPASKPKP